MTHFFVSAAHRFINAKPAAESVPPTMELAARDSVLTLAGELFHAFREEDSSLGSRFQNPPFHGMIAASVFSGSRFEVNRLTAARELRSGS